MNAIQTNHFTKTLATLGKKIPKPKAILCISAHWLTEGSWVTHMAKPRTIHDFYEFPKELFDVRYPAPGSPQTAELVRSTVSELKIHLDDEMWGLDHGTWSVLKHIYPEANIPVIQLSIDHTQPFSYHYELGKKISVLRSQGVLIVGSGNVVHNLRQLNWDESGMPFEWAIEFDEWVKLKLLKKDYPALITDYHKTQAGKLSVPTTDHYIPLIYALGASDKKSADVDFVYEGIDNGSVSMRSFLI